MNTMLGAVVARSGARHARMRYRPPRTFDRFQVPSAAVGTRAVATASPTSRSSWTMAPGTTPSGPATLPTMVTGPGPMTIDVDVVVPSTRGSGCEARSVAGAVVDVVASSGTVFGVGSLAKGSRRPL